MRAPLPFVVGAPRSGTTLLRLMLDAHSQLAIPPETGFVPSLLALGTEATPEKAVALMVGFESWPDFGLEARALAEELQARECRTPAEALRGFQRLYAARQGKPRAGDKTPSYALHLDPIAETWPEARIVHLIRDGRDVAHSWRPLWFAPGRDIATLAAAWAGHVEAARAFGRRRPERYFELRYELLVADPALALGALCDFLELSFEPPMLRPHERAPERLGEHRGRWRADGSQWLSREDRLRQQGALLEAPHTGRIGVWREHWTEAETREFERAAGGLLSELGYDAA